MKDLLKTYAPVAFLATGAFIYWSFGSINALRATVDELREQNVNIVLGMTSNCKALFEKEGHIVLTAEEAEEYNAKPHSKRAEEEDSPEGETSKE